MTHGQIVEHAAPAKRSSGLRNHTWQRPVRRVPHAPISRPNSFETGVRALFPWTAYTYPGVIAGTVELLQRRVKRATVKAWRQHKRKPPPWAWALLAAAIERRIAELQHALALIKKEAGD